MKFDLNKLYIKSYFECNWEKLKINLVLVYVNVYF